MKKLRDFFNEQLAPAKDFTPDNPVMMPNWAVTAVKNWILQDGSHTNPYSSQFSTETQKECIGAYERGRLQFKAELLENLESSVHKGEKTE